MNETNMSTKKRTLLEISGQDRLKFLEALITNSVTQKSNILTYTALLTPQGKYLFDFFIFCHKNAVFLDVASARAGALKTLLEFYKLRADVTIKDSKYHVALSRSTFQRTKNSNLIYQDPRHSSLGWRIYGEKNFLPENDDFTPERVQYVVPEYKSELIENETYILEAGFERLNGVNFKKGCFIGQEIIARMKHKTTLRKGFCRVAIDGVATCGETLVSDGKNVGHICSIHQNQAIAYLHYTRVKSEITTRNAHININWRPT